jgi:hypothetical protein
MDSQNVDSSHDIVVNHDLRKAFDSFFFHDVFQTLYNQQITSRNL